MSNERRPEEGPLPEPSRDRLEAGRNRYDSATWRRIYDSFAWRWVVGPMAYGAIVAVAYAVIFNRSIAVGLVFGAFMVLFVLAMNTLHGQPGRRER